MPTDDQTEAEALDDDELSEVYPPEHLLGADEYGTTAAEERVNEPIEQQVLRELPDHLAPAREEPPTLIATGDGSSPDDEVAHEGGDGRLLGLAARQDPLEEDTERLGRAERSVEEEAMHIEPPR